MAVIPELPGLHVTVEVEGTALPEHDNGAADMGHAYPQNRTTKYIETPAGEEFEIRMCYQAPFNPPLSVHVEIMLDGNTCWLHTWTLVARKAAKAISSVKRHSWKKARPRLGIFPSLRSRLVSTSASYSRPRLTPCRGTRRSSHRGNEAQDLVHWSDHTVYVLHRAHGRIKIYCDTSTDF